MPLSPLRSPWLWALLALVPLTLFPTIDIGVSALFFDPAQRAFPFRVHPLGEFARKTVPAILFAVAGLIALTGIAAALRRRPIMGVTPRAALLVVASLALGPGLLVNVVLKDNWGRARPSTIAEFNAGHQPDRRHTPPLVISDQCDDNCSFPSGHAALGFWTLSLALIVPPRRRPAAVGAALAFGCAMGLVRIAQGGHFLSDVAYSGVIVTGLTVWLYCRLFPSTRLGTGKNNSEDSSSAP